MTVQMLPLYRIISFLTLGCCLFAVDANADPSILDGNEQSARTTYATQFPYDGGIARVDWADLTDGEYIEIELGETSNPDVIFTIIDATSVSDASGTWANNSKTFTTPTSGWLEVDAVGVEGGDTKTKKIHIHPKPHGAL